MYSSENISKLYSLINEFLNHNLTEEQFCDEFHNLFVNDIDVNDFSHEEFLIFSELNDSVQKFSNFKEDFEFWKGFINKDELNLKVRESLLKLKELPDR